MSRVPAVLTRGLLLLVAAVLPAAFPPGWPTRLDLVVLVVVAAGLMGGPVTGALTGLAGGWVLDLVPPGGAPLGAAALSYLVAGALAGVARRYVTWSAVLPALVTVAATTWLQGVRGVLAAAGAGTADPANLLSTVLLTGLAGVVVVPLVVALERRLLARRWAGPA